jgi:hypothetical protein
MACKRRKKTVKVRPHSRSPRGANGKKKRPSVKTYKRRTPC